MIYIDLFTKVNSVMLYNRKNICRIVNCTFVKKETVHGNIYSEIAVYLSRYYPGLSCREVGKCLIPVRRKLGKLHSRSISRAQRIHTYIEYKLQWLSRLYAGYIINQSRLATNTTSFAHLEFPHGISLTNPRTAQRLCI